MPTHGRCAQSALQILPYVAKNTMSDPAPSQTTSRAPFCLEKRLQRLYRGALLTPSSRPVASSEQQGEPRAPCALRPCSWSLLGAVRPSH